MTEIYNAKNCALLEGARELAGKKGLDTSKLICSAINDCDGSFCIYLSPSGETGPQQLEKFKTRQEKTDEIKLGKLREELKTIENEAHTKMQDAYYRVFPERTGTYK